MQNKNDFLLRPEQEHDYPITENLVREAFWNLYGPGCDEHYLVQKMRSHPDFVPALTYVCQAYVRQADSEVRGCIYYTKAKLIREDGQEKTILTFGPLAVHPAYQRQGIGKRLIEHTFALAKTMGYDTVVIFGHPGNYVARGFVSCQRRQVYIGDGLYPTAMLVKELVPGVLEGHRWQYRESDVGDCLADQEAVAVFDGNFPYKPKITGTPSQEEFYIYSHSTVRG